MNDEDKRFREWLKSLDVLPGEIPGDTSWNNQVVVNTADYVYGEEER